MPSLTMPRGMPFERLYRTNSTKPPVTGTVSRKASSRSSGASMSGICRSMHWRAEMAPRTHSSSMVFQAGRANRSRIASVTSNGVTVPSKSQMTEYGPAAKSGNWNTSCFSVKG